MKYLRRIAIGGHLLIGAAQLLAQNFTDVTSTVGLDHIHHNIWDREDLKTYKAGGACAGDYNNDGFTDLYVTIIDGPDILYQNDSGEGFINKTTEALGTAHLANIESNGCAWGDVDNDGDLDLYVTSLGSNRYHLFINSGAPNYTFTEEAGIRGADVVSADLHYGTSVAFGDADSDGYLDIYVAEWRTKEDNPDGAPHNNRLLINQGAANPGHFTDRTFLAGVTTDAVEASNPLVDSQGYAPRIIDLDMDSIPDLILSSDNRTSRLWWGNGDGSFTDGTGDAGVGTDMSGMGSTVGDFDRDGDFDWFVTSISHSEGINPQRGNRLYRNEGDRHFTDATDAAGVRHTDWGWAAAFFDFDHDQDLDLIAANGIYAPFSVREDFLDDPTTLFENDGSGVFTNITGPASGINDTGMGKGLLLLDYDNDGDQDIYIANNGAAPIFYENQTNGAGDWLKIDLEGTASNRQGIGAIVTVIAKQGETPMLRFNDGGSNFLGQNEAGIHVGLGTPDTSPVYAIVIRWPSGRIQALSDVARNQRIHVVEPDEASTARVTLSSSTLEPGDSLTADFETGSLPANWTATWVVDGQSYSSPLTLQPNSPGVVVLNLEILDDSQPPQVVWKENRRVTVNGYENENKSIARLWNEQNLEAIRIDFPDPTKHARNLFQTSVAMWDAWAAFDPTATGYIHRESASAADTETARNEAISYAAYRVLRARYADSVNAYTTLTRLELLMNQLGYDTATETTVGTAPSALGNRIAAAVLEFADWDGWDVEDVFMGASYSVRNDPLPVYQTGVTLLDPNRWQPLLFKEAVTQNGLPADVIQTFLGDNWGIVRPFALDSLNGSDLHIDPGQPPQWGGASEAAYKAGNLDVIRFSSLLDPNQSEIIDISPSAYGNSTLGTNDGSGRATNPFTMQAYPPNEVLHADLGRVLAEFWADGPDSETPPGHWNKLANDVVDHPEFEARFTGNGAMIDPLQWDVFMYFALNGALHDAAVVAWGCKRVYDYIRPISSIRYLCALGQSSDPAGPAYHAGGIPLEDGLVEVITAQSAAAGERHAHLSEHIGEIAIYAWRGEAAGLQSGVAGVGWILGEAWMPYQNATFVNPAFAGYVSGHSTFSRAAAEVMTQLTGSEYFPGGLASFTAEQDAYLKFETGPSTDVTLQWATYYDAADQAGLSRLYGGIHVPADDGPGRIMGAHCGERAWAEAIKYLDGSIHDEPSQARISTNQAGEIMLEWDGIRGFHYRIHRSGNLTGFTPDPSWFRAGETDEQAIVEENIDAGPGAQFYIIEREENP